MDLLDELQRLRDRLDPPPTTDQPGGGPALIDQIQVRPHQGADVETLSVPPAVAEAEAAAYRRMHGLPPPAQERMSSADAEDEARRYRAGLSNESRANITNANASGPRDPWLDKPQAARMADVRAAQTTPDPAVKPAEPHPSIYRDGPSQDPVVRARQILLMKATHGRFMPFGPEGAPVDMGANVHLVDQPPPMAARAGTLPPVGRGPANKPPSPTATAGNAQAAASPEQKTQTAPGGGALGADPRKAALQMALTAIPDSNVRALLAKRLQLATDGDTELRAAQQRGEQLGALAGLQRQLGMAASTMAGEKYDDTAAAANENAATTRARNLLAQRAQMDKNAQGALDILGEQEKERAGRAGEALKGQELGLEGERQAETGRHNRESEKIDWYQARTQREKALKGAGAGGAAEKDVQKLAKEVGGNVAIGAQKLQEIDQALRAQGIQGIDDLSTKRDLQGGGPLTNLVTKFTGNTFISQKGANLRNGMLGLAATIKYLRTGKTATKQEAEEIAQEFGMAPGSSETDLRKGIQRMRDEFVSRSRQSEAGFTPATVSTFEQRGGTTSRALQNVGKQPGARKQGKSGRWYTWDGQGWVPE